MVEIDTPLAPSLVPEKKSKSKARRKSREEYSHQQNYCCAICRHVITNSANATVKQGNHFHDRVNPDGRRFMIACFGDAPGCYTSGTATLAHSWFSGYPWTFAHCANCSCQVGWHYQGEDEFFGLMLEQLVDCWTGTPG